MKGLILMKIIKRIIITLLLISMIATMLPVLSSASGVIAWGAANVNGSVVRIRSGPSLDDTVLTQVSRGEVVVIIERTNSEWHKVNYHGTIGYMSVPLLDNHRQAANFKARGSITGDVVNMRERPNTTSSVLDQYTQGTEMTIIGINDGWYKVEHGSNTGYIRSDLMKILSNGSSSSGSSNPAVRSLGQQIADYAAGFAGYNYVYGGSSPSGFDCSGLVSYVMRQFGISVTRNASGQYRDNGYHINKSDMAPGDLIFFSDNGNSVTHVGIYLGNSRFIHASGTNIGVIVSRTDTALYEKNYFGAKRVV